MRGLKIRGVYGTKEEADERAKELQKFDPDFHVFVGEVGKWLPWDPDPNDIKDQQYQEEELQKLMVGYKDNLEKAKKMQQQRKTDMIRQAAAQEQSREEKQRAKLRKKLEAKKQLSTIESIVNKNTNETISDEEPVPIVDKDIQLKQEEELLKKQEELAKSEKQRLDKTQKELNEKEQNLQTLDSKLAKIQELYDKLNKAKK